MLRHIIIVTKDRSILAYFVTVGNGQFAGLSGTLHLELVHAKISGGVHTIGTHIGRSQSEVNRYYLAQARQVKESPVISSLQLAIGKLNEIHRNGRLITLGINTMGGELKIVTLFKSTAEIVTMRTTVIGPGVVAHIHAHGLKSRAAVCIHKHHLIAGTFHSPAAVIGHEIGLIGVGSHRTVSIDDATATGHAATKVGCPRTTAARLTIVGDVTTDSGGETVPVGATPRGALAVNKVREHELAILVTELEPRIIYIIVALGPHIVGTILNGCRINRLVQVKCNHISPSGRSHQGTCSKCK